MSVRAPEFPTGCVWFNSEPLRLADLRGRIVVLEFWTFCCINCHHNIAQLHELMARYGDALVVIGVHSAKFPAEHAAANVRSAVLRDGIRYAVVVDDNFTIWNQYAVRAWPTLVLIDAAGRIARTHMGEFLADDLAATIDIAISAATERGTLDSRPLAHTPEVDHAPDGCIAVSVTAPGCPGRHALRGRHRPPSHPRNQRRCGGCNGRDRADVGRW